MKETIAVAKKKAAFARHIYNRSFTAFDDAIPALLSLFHGLKRALDETADATLAAIDATLIAEISRIGTFYEEYLSGKPSGFSRKDLNKSITTASQLADKLEKYRIQHVAGRRERIIVKVLKGMVITSFAALFVSVGVGLAVGLSLPGYDEGLTGNYFSNMKFGGRRYQTIDHKIDFNWEGSSPFKGISPNRFSIRWEGCVRVDAPKGMFFSASADEDIRVYIDGDLVIDTWNSKNFQTVNTNSRIAPGIHPIEIQYREEKGAAHVFLGWTPDGKKPVVVPPKNLIPRNLVLGGAGSNKQCPAMPPIKPKKKKVP